MTVERPGNLEDTDLDQFMLTQMPHFVAVHYQRMLEAEMWEGRIREALRVFELGLRALALAMVSQYLIRDRDLVSDPILNRLLRNKLPFATLHTWKEILFRTLQAYAGARDRFFVPELYDFYWDTIHEPHLPRDNVEAPFDELLRFYNTFGREQSISQTPADELAEVFSEVARLLRSILEQFRFIGKYELIKVLKSTDEGYSYERHTGLVVEPASHPLRTSEELQPGFFYLLNREHGTTLLLYPMVILYQLRKMAAALKAGETESAIYERLMPDSVRYLLPILYEHRENRELLTDFVRQVILAVEQVKMERREVHRLIWPLLQEVARAITEQQTGEMRQKYDPTLYLQRNKTKAAFDDFLASDKTCFVLIGQSGVGKSNFVLSVLDELREKRSDVCVLAYNGANLDGTKPLSQTLKEDFRRYLKFKGLTGEEETVDVLYETSQIEGITSRILLLMVDAINENPEARELLRRVDEVVREYELLWLKVVVTSRPEAWRAMKRGLRLTEHKYYWEKGRDQIGVELERFTYREEGERLTAERPPVGRPVEKQEPWIEIEPFTREELPEVYEKYRQVFRLKTAYDALKPEVKRALRDPLNLRLVAGMHAEQEIPKAITVTDISQQYVDYLVAMGRLDPADVKFLEGELMPRMISDDHYANSIAAPQVLEDDGLFCLIHDDGYTTAGRRVNKSYVNLVDAGILVQQGEGISYEIGFRYERFYDYFGGNRFHRLAEGGICLEEFYVEHIQRIEQFPYLWGPVKTAIIQELRENAQDLVAQLSWTTKQLVKEMMVQVLIEYGQDEPESTHSILVQIMNGQLDSGRERRYGSWPKLVGTSERLAQEAVNAKKVAMEVARELGMEDILSKGAIDRSAVVREHAVQNICYFWDREKGRGFDLLCTLTRAIRPGLLPNTRALTSSLNISLYIFLKNYRFLADPEQLDQVNQLQTIWKPVIEALLYYNPQSGTRSRVKEWFKHPIREFMLSRGIEVVLAIIRDMPIRTSWHPWEIAAFFCLPADRKARVRRLLPLMDPSYDASIEDFRPDLLEAAREGDLGTAVVVEQGLNVHHLYRHVNVLPLVRELYDIAMERRPPNIFAGAMMHAAFTLADSLGDKVDQQALKCYRDMIVEYYDSVEDLLLQGHRGKYVAYNLGHYACLYYRLYGTTNVDLIERYGARIRQQRDEKLARDFLYDIEELVANPKYLWVGLAALRQIIDFDASIAEDEIVNLLAKLRLRNPEALDLFLDEIMAPSDFRRRVEAKEIRESAGESLRKYSLAMEVEALQMPALWQELQWVFNTACECRSLTQCAKIIARKLVNMAYGAPIFTVENTSLTY